MNGIEGVSGTHIFLFMCFLVYVLGIMVDNDNKTQNCPFQFVKC